MAYLEPCDLKKTKIGIDFSKYDDELLESFIEMSQEMIDTFISRTFDEGPFDEEGETIIAKDLRILVKLKNSSVKEINSLKFSVLGGADIIADVTLIDLYKEQGYLYYNTSRYVGTGYGWGGYNGSYPSSRMSLGQKVKYEVNYSRNADDIPATIKYCTSVVCGNLLKADSNFENTGAILQSGDIVAFSSGDYNVNFGKNGEKGSSGENSGTLNLANNIMTPTVISLLTKYKRMGQNTI